MIFFARQNSPKNILKRDYAIDSVGTSGLGSVVCGLCRAEKNAKIFECEDFASFATVNHNRRGREKCFNFHDSDNFCVLISICLHKPRNYLLDFANLFLFH
jgi:hypothetical protein